MIDKSLASQDTVLRMRIVAWFALVMNISIDESVHRSDAIWRHSRAIKARLMAFLPGLASTALLFGRLTTMGRWEIMRNVWPVPATRIRGYVDEIRRLHTEFKSSSILNEGKIKGQETKRETLMPRSLPSIKSDLKRMHLDKRLRPLFISTRRCLRAV